MSPLIIRGAYLADTGYGAHIRSHLRLLDRAGIPFSLINVPLDPNEMMSDEIQQWRGRVIESPRRGDLVINFCEAPYYKFYAGCRHIGYTMWEVDKLPDEKDSPDPSHRWVELMNQCDEIWTGSTFSQKVFKDSGVTCPVRVVPWPVEPRESIAPVSKLSEIYVYVLPAWVPQRSLHSFAQQIYLKIMDFGKMGRFFVQLGYFCFQVLQGFLMWLRAVQVLMSRQSAFFPKQQVRFYASSTFNERKNFADLVTAFSFEFSKQDSVALFIRTHHAVFSLWMKLKIIQEIQRWVDELKIQDRPPIYLILDPLKDSEREAIESQMHFYINASKGEGVGGGLLSAMAKGIPAITHLFSAPADFCNEENSFIYEYDLEPVRWNFKFYGMRQRWARPDMESFRQALKRALEAYSTDEGKYRRMQSIVQKAVLSYGSPQNVLSAYLESVKTTGR